MIFCGLFTAVNSAFAQTWIQQTNAPTTNWTAIVSSTDGNKLAAVSGGTCYTSTNSGTTWITNNLPADSHVDPLNPPHFNVLAASAAGTQLVGAAYNSGIIGVSTNWGFTWSYPTNYADADWNSIASSADGKTLVLTESGPAIPTVYASTNSGATWYLLTQLPNNGSQSPFAAMSADGNCLAVAVYDRCICSTTNFGKSWMTNNLSEPWDAIAMSADGTKLVAAPAGGNIYTSTDFGVTWVQQTNSPNLLWSFVASSADGTKLVAAVYGSAIYTSTNSGNTWTSNNAPNLPWETVVSSADGNKLAAAVYGADGGIWTLQTTPTPQLNIQIQNTDLALSWLIPSTNFALQQNLDLTTTNWMTLTNEPTLNLTNLNDEVVLPQTNSSGFFRLMAQ